uniref:N-acetylmuramoyl-L-alanine amidase-like domain-containing protein n=1 Tax=Xylanibacter rodentium TaxID=2736289 RepID=UPI00259B81AA
SKDCVGNNGLMRKAVEDGDIIAITCRKKGLDIAHLGYAVWRNDGLHLLNASMIHHKVVEEPMTLYRYLQKHPSHTGIRIVRINKCN